MSGRGTVQEDLLISHRVLNEEEAYTIWTVLDSPVLPTKNQELRIVLKPAGKLQVREWMICTDLQLRSFFSNGHPQN